MFPHFEVAHRFRPVALVRDERTSGFHAAYVAVEATPAPGAAEVRLELEGPAGVRLAGLWSPQLGRIRLETTIAGRIRNHRSLRHGRLRTPPGEVALTLTGRWLCAWTRGSGPGAAGGGSGGGGEWTVRARLALPPLLEPRDPAFLAGLSVATPQGVSSWKAGTFGQLGLRDLHLVTHADGAPYDRAGRFFLTATQAGPGFADTAQTGVWSWLPGTDDLQPEALLWWRRDGRVMGDHATHLVRDGRRWLVATSTWADFDRTHVGITLATSTDDLLTGEHILEGEDLALPTPPGTVGVWDPHLALVDGRWHVAFVAARSFFDFRPALARTVTAARRTTTAAHSEDNECALGGLELVGVVEDRTATEGCVLVQPDSAGGDWVMLASDGRDNPPGKRERYPVFDLELREIGELDAAYGSNIPWPMVVPHPGAQGPGWSLITFDGTPCGGRLAGYGTHGDVVVMRAVARGTGPGAQTETS